jgi:hypothetical protein
VLSGGGDVERGSSNMLGECSCVCVCVSLCVRVCGGGGGAYLLGQRHASQSWWSPSAIAVMSLGRGSMCVCVCVCVWCVACAPGCVC